MPSNTIASASKRTSANDIGHDAVPLVYQPFQSNSSGSSTPSEFPRSAPSQKHRSRTDFTLSRPASPPYTPSSNDRYPSSGPTMVDISATPDLITPMLGFNFDNGSVMSYPWAYPSRNEAETYYLAPLHSLGLFPATTVVHGDGYHGTTSASVPVSSVHAGGLRRTIGHASPVYGSALPPLTYISRMSTSELVGLGIALPSGEPDLLDGLKPHGQPGSTIYSSMCVDRIATRQQKQ